MKLSIEFDVSEEFLGDVLTNVVESGSISYWACYLEIDRAPDLNVTRALILEVEDDGQDEDDMPKHTIDFRVLLRGMYLAIAGECRSDLADYIRNGVATNDAGDIDSDCCDVIVQLGLFGEVRYG